MNRNVALLSGLIVVAVLLAWWFLLYSPKGEEITEVNEQIEAVQAQQVQARNRINNLKDVRQRAPEIEAQINAADAIVPPDPALPAALRQLQMASDAAGVELPTISISRPSAAEGASPMSVSLSISGGYFQIIDFLRRIEDPTITPRGIVWNSISLSPSGYPVLTASLSGSMFARNVPAPVVDLEGVEVEVETDVEADGDTEVDVDTDPEEAA